MIANIGTAHGLCLGVVLVAVSGLDSRAAENWPQWRGPLANGVAADGGYPVDFASDQGVAWKATLPGVGCSTPAVWDDSIFVTCGIDGQDGVVCYGMDGSERWRRQLGSERSGKHRNGSGSNPSPVTDGEHVVVYFKSGTLACFDFAGRELWRTNLQEKFGEDTLWWDLGTSPVLAGDRVIVAVMQVGESYLVALDIATGDVFWKEPRQFERPQESDQAYTTPQVAHIDGRDQLVVWGADHLTGHDLETGKMLWQCGGFNPDDQPMWRVIASPAIDGGFAVVPYGRGDYLVGVRLGGEGDITERARVWEKQGRGQGADVPAPAVKDGRAYVLGDAGRITCLAVATGDEIWTDDLPRSRSKFFSSPVLAGDKLYAAREDGMVFVGRVSDDGFELLAENDMGEPIIAMPVPIRGGLLIRGREHLFRIASGDEL
jgi:outer membrane protein assembly factor BamB